MNTNQKTSPPLPVRAEFLTETITLTTGTLLPQKVDAVLELFGLKWFRVHGGFGGRFDREDWIADLPGISVTVCDYHWNGSDFGPSYDSFEDACRGQMKDALRIAHMVKAETETKLATLTASIARLEQSFLLPHNLERMDS